MKRLCTHRLKCQINGIATSESVYKIYEDFLAIGEWLISLCLQSFVWLYQFNQKFIEWFCPVFLKKLTCMNIGITEIYRRDNFYHGSYSTLKYKQTNSNKSFTLFWSIYQFFLNATKWKQTSLNWGYHARNSQSNSKDLIQR